MAFFQKEKEKGKVDEHLDFAKFFGPLIPSFKNLKTAGHFISGLSESVVIFKTAFSHLPIAWKLLLILFSLMLTFIAVFIIEHGLSKTYSMWIRQIIRWKFKNRWFIIMFCILTIIVVPLLFASPTLSSWGGEDFVEENFTDGERSNTDSITYTASVQLQKIDSLFTIDSIRIANRYKSKADAIANRYKTKIAIMERKKEIQLNKAKNGHKWANGHAQIAHNQILAYQSEFAAELDTLGNAEFQSIQASDLARMDAIFKINADKEQQLSFILSDDTERIDKMKTKKTKWTKAMMYLCGFAALMVVISITVIELYRAGSGQETQQKVDKEELGKVAFLFNILGQKWNEFYWRKIDAINVSKPKPSMQFKFQQNGDNASSLVTTKITASTPVISAEERIAQIARQKQRINTYEWKIRNKQGTLKTANKNIADAKSKLKSWGVDL